MIHLAILTAFFLVPWWLRPQYQRPEWLSFTPPYFFGFLLTIPVGIAIVGWIVLGFPGLRSALNDGRRWWIASAVLLLSWALLSIQWANHPRDSVNAASQLAGVMLFTLVITCAGPSARQVTAALAMGLIFQAVIAIAQTSLQHQVGLAWLGEFEVRAKNVGLSILSDGPDIWMRPYGMTIHPNVIGGYFAVALLAMTGWLPDLGLQRWRYIVRLGVAALGLWALCLTFSRSAWGALVVGLIVIALGWRKIGLKIPRQRLLIVTMGAVLLIGIFGVSYGRWIAQRTDFASASAATSDTTENRSISDRRVFFEIALQVIREHPLQGVGIGNFAWEATEIIRQGPYKGWLKGDNVHNIALLAFGELGTIGFGLWLLTWLSGLIQAIRMVRDPFAIGLVAGCVALLAIGMLDHYPWSIFHFALLLWSTLGIALQPTIAESHPVSVANEES
jgi:hypothetical protein